MSEMPEDLRLEGSFHTLEREIGGREVAFLLATRDPAEARSLLPRLHHAIESAAQLRRRAVAAVLSGLGDQPPTAEDLAEAEQDLVLEAVEIEVEGELVLHLADSCGEHILDGYWPAVRFDREDGVVQVTVEA